MRQVKVQFQLTTVLLISVPAGISSSVPGFNLARDAGATLGQGAR